MTNFCGVHATNKTRAGLIRQGGFHAGSVENSRRGTGVYFWPLNSYHRDLAFGHYLMATRHYRENEDHTCVFIFAIFSALESEYLDYTDNEIMDMFIALIKEKEIFDKKNACKLYDEFCDMIEKDLGLEIKVVLAPIVPPKLAGFPIQTVCYARTYIVRDTGCIHIEKCEEVADYEK
ncbi:MAG: hypothetical protein J7K75_08540 [Desulfuromonas sp.]|nr:hypothetical protein [Desulfuromonas sp.]